MAQNNERLVKNERRNSLAAFLRTLKFSKPNNDQAAQMTPGAAFARPQLRTRQTATVNEESRWIRSAN